MQTHPTFYLKLSCSVEQGGSLCLGVGVQWHPFSQERPAGKKGGTSTPIPIEGSKRTILAQLANLICSKLKTGDSFTLTWHGKQISHSVEKTPSCTPVWRSHMFCKSQRLDNIVMYPGKSNIDNIWVRFLHNMLTEFVFCTTDWGTYLKTIQQSLWTPEVNLIYLNRSFESDFRGSQWTLGRRICWIRVCGLRCSDSLTCNACF